MKLACITIFRNEGSILNPFLDQLTTFFDHAVLINHSSTDCSSSLISARCDERLQLLQLQASGYPQSELTTCIAHRILKTHEPDFLFILDCDEFLPFADRAALESFLDMYRDYEVLMLRWRQICPESFDGDNIFAGRFVQAEHLSSFTKVILNGCMRSRKGWIVGEGSHFVQIPKGESIKIAKVQDTGLLHIPVQSRIQFRFKIAAGARRTRRDKAKLAAGFCNHWIELDKKSMQGQLDMATLKSIALNYPQFTIDQVSNTQLNFDFPYIRTAYAEDATSFIGQLDGLLQFFDSKPASEYVSTFTLCDPKGDVILSRSLSSWKRISGWPRYSMWLRSWYKWLRQTMRGFLLLTR